MYSKITPKGVALSFLKREWVEIKKKNKKMNKRLYIGSLSFDTTEETLKDLFSQAGKVNSVSIIVDKFSGKSRGFGFVEMEDEEGAKKAIEMFNGKELDGRKIIVDEARPQRKRNFRRFSQRKIRK